MFLKLSMLLETYVKFCIRGKCFKTTLLPQRWAKWYKKYLSFFCLFVACSFFLDYAVTVLLFKLWRCKFHFEKYMLFFLPILCIYKLAVCELPSMGRWNIVKVCVHYFVSFEISSRLRKRLKTMENGFYFI